MQDVKLTLDRRQKKDNTIPTIFLKLLIVKTENKQRRFTLSLPNALHEELTKVASDNGVSSRDIVLKSLKIGLLAMRLDGTPDKQLVIKEVNNGIESETKLLII